MNVRRLVFLPFLALALLLQLVGGSTAGATPTINGRVTDSLGHPIAGVSIAASPAGQTSVVGTTVTGDDGTFALAVDDGTYDFTLTSDDPAFRVTHLTNLAVSAGTPVTFVLVSSGRITVTGRSGLIVDGDFIGANYGSVTFYPLDSTLPTSTARISGGTFSVDLIAGAKYQMSDNFQVSYRSTFINLNKFAFAKTYSFNDGDELDLAVPAAQVTVAVQDQSGKPQQAARLYFNGLTIGPDTDNFRGYGQCGGTDENGTTTCLLPIGASDTSANLTLTGGLSIKAPFHDIDLSSVISVTTPITARVTGRSGLTVDGDFIGANYGSVTFYPLDSTLPTSTARISGGTFSVDLIAGAKYQMSDNFQVSYRSTFINLNKFAFAKTYSFNDGDELDLAVPAAQVTVAVQDQSGKPQQAARLYFNGLTIGPDTDNFRGYGQCGGTDENGTTTCLLPIGASDTSANLTLTGGLSYRLAIDKIQGDLLLVIDIDGSGGATTTPVPVVQLTANAGTIAGDAISLHAKAGRGIVVGSTPAGTVRFSYSVNGGARHDIGDPVVVDADGKADLELPDGLPHDGDGTFRYSIVASFTPDDPSKFASGESQPVVVTQKSIPRLTSVSVTPPSASIFGGDSQQLQAIGSYTDGSTKDLTDSAVWTSSDTDVATVTQAGRVDGRTLGTSTITATVGSSSGTSRIDVTHESQHFTVTPVSRTITYGDTEPTFDYVVSGGGSDSLTTRPTCGVAGPHVDAGTYPITCSGAAAPYNDTVTYAAGTLTVTKAPVTISPSDQHITYGDADPAFGFSVAGLPDGTSLASAPVCTVAGAHRDASSYPITCAGADAGPNYAITYGTGTLTIGKAPLTVTPSDQHVTYGDSDPTFAYAVTGLRGSDTVTTAPSCTVVGAHRNAGAYPITCTGANAGPNYAITYGTGTLTVAEASITITAADHSITYGDTDPAFTYATAGLRGSDTLTRAPACGVAGVHRDAGTYPITCTGADAGPNYAITYGTGTLTIGRSAVTVTPADQRITYGDTDPRFGYTVTGLPAGTSLSTAPSCSVAGAHRNAGTYPITCTGADAGPNYAITYGTGTLTVGKTTVSISPSDQRTTFGDSDPAFGYTTAGLRGGDSLTISPSCGVNGAHRNAGTYPITCTGADAGPNYTITYGTGTLTVGKAPVTVTASDQTVTYGDSDPTFTYTVSGLPSGASLAATPSCTVAGAHRSAGTYPITCTGADAGPNYTITYGSGTLSTTRAPLTVAAPVVDTTYGVKAGSLTFTPTVAGLRGSDTSGGIGLGTTTCRPAVAPTSGGSYPVGTSTITCTATGTPANYVPTFVPGTLTVAKAVLTVTADTVTRQYGHAGPALTASVSGLVNGDSAAAYSGSAGLSSTGGTTSHPGSYPIAITAGTLAAANYTVRLVPGTLIIVKATTTLSASYTNVGLFGSGLITVTAQLTDDVGNPVVGRKLTFSDRGLFGDQTRCPDAQATNSRGQVVCQYTGVIRSSYNVTFAGDTDYLGATVARNY